MRRKLIVDSLPNIPGAKVEFARMQDIPPTIVSQFVTVCDALFGVEEHNRMEALARKDQRHTAVVDWVRHAIYFWSCAPQVFLLLDSAVSTQLTTGALADVEGDLQTLWTLSPSCTTSYFIATEMEQDGWLPDGAFVTWNVAADGGGYHDFGFAPVQAGRLRQMTTVQTHGKGYNYSTTSLLTGDLIRPSKGSPELITLLKLIHVTAAIQNRKTPHQVVTASPLARKANKQQRVSRHHYTTLRLIDHGKATLVRGAPIHPPQGRTGKGIYLGAPPLPETQVTEAAPVDAPVRTVARHLSTSTVVGSGSYPKAPSRWGSAPTTVERHFLPSPGDEEDTSMGVESSNLEFSRL